MDVVISDQISSLESIYEIRYQRIIAELSRLESKLEDQKEKINKCKQEMQQQQQDFRQYKLDSYAGLVGKSFMPDVIYSIKFQSSRYLSKLEKLKKILTKETEELNRLSKKHKEIKIKIRLNLVKQKKYEFIKNNI